MAPAPTGSAFVRAIARALGIDPSSATPQADLWRALGKDVDRTQLNKWWNGTNNPSFVGMMVMLGRAGWLTQEALQRLTEEQLAEAAERTAAADKAVRKASSPRRLPKTEEQR